MSLRSGNLDTTTPPKSIHFSIYHILPLFKTLVVIIFFVAIRYMVVIVPLRQLVAVKAITRFSYPTSFSSFPFLFQAFSSFPNFSVLSVLYLPLLSSLKHEFSWRPFPNRHHHLSLCLSCCFFLASFLLVFLPTSPSPQIVSVLLPLLLFPCLLASTCTTRCSP